ncbi:SAM-dependent methyltransferase [Legionella beliardensis]|uniref:SAM-dependent methyltransferase n=1 Tax=Legionella beliardensis TaxID=91822 RepID=A0A378I339_9GAMM|nr:hypothetical protein [Legionella beliardensis]STX29578.1 SAM-dependent methyltransferase [Legionella beliardensis]
MSNLVLWGHHVDEYKEMFDLSDDNFTGRLLEYGSGPSAVNAKLTYDQKQCISCDPFFALDKATLMSKTTLIFANMVDDLTKEQDHFNFSVYGNLDGLIQKRRLGMKRFFDDYLLGKQEKRYLPLQEINLPFADFYFDLALSSHYLFADLENQDVDFQVKAIKELARVAKEVRIFPLINRDGQPSAFLGPVLLQLQQDNYGIEVKSVIYNLQPKGNAMLRVWAQQCTL